MFIYYLIISISMANTTKNSVGVQTKCLFCDYDWKTTSKHTYVSCPSCLNKVRLAPYIRKSKKTGVVENNENTETAGSNTGCQNQTC